jgi:hypothetical protein
MTGPLDTTFETFFETKTASDVEGTMAFFSPDLVSYIDATLGWDFDSYDALKGAFVQYMPNWSTPARSYTTRVLANDTSALVHMTDTPELFGGELRILAAIDFAEARSSIGSTIGIPHRSTTRCTPSFERRATASRRT